MNACAQMMTVLYVLHVSLIVGRQDMEIEKKRNETVIHRNQCDRPLAKKNDSDSRSFARTCVRIRSFFFSLGCSQDD
jgi:hypothetical protein